MDHGPPYSRTPPNPMQHPSDRPTLAELSEALPHPPPPSPAFDSALYGRDPEAIDKAIGGVTPEPEPADRRDTMQSPPSEPEPSPDIIPGSEIRALFDVVMKRLDRIEEVAEGARQAALHKAQDELAQSDKVATLRRDVDSLQCRRPPSCEFRPSLTAIPGGNGS